LQIYYFDKKQKVIENAKDSKNVILK